MNNICHSPEEAMHYDCEQCDRDCVYRKDSSGCLSLLIIIVLVTTVIFAIFL